MSKVAMYSEEEDGFEDASSSSSSSSSNGSYFALIQEARTQVKKLRQEARAQDRPNSWFRSQCALAISVGFWVAVFGYPMYSLVGYRWLFGLRGPLLERVSEEISTGNVTLRDIQVIQKLRISCGPLDAGRMRNIAGPSEEVDLMPWKEGMVPWNPQTTNDIWCGWLSGNYLDYWPNVAQLIIFTVYKNTGTTVNLAWQGVVGTFFACANMVFMQMLYPAGAAGHTCMRGTAAMGWIYTTIWHSNGAFHWKLSQEFGKAQQHYQKSSMRGRVNARAIFDGDGELVAGWFLNPELKEKTLQKMESIRGENCTQGEMVYNSPGYNHWVCMLDVVAVLFLFLISRSSMNTIMFGMSWHICFMMDFMNPEKGVKDCTSWDCILLNSVHGAVFKTTWIGALIAIMATLTCSFCLPLSHLRNLQEDSLAMTQAVIRIWKDSMEYLKGTTRSAKRFQIQTQIQNLSKDFTRAQEDADGAWWETFDQGRWGATRRLLKEYDTRTADIRDMMTCVRGCVLHEDFGGDHAAFWTATRPSMARLQEDTEELMYSILQACRDGVITDQEAHVIDDLVARVKEQQRELVRAFHKASPDVSEDLADENIYAYALSFWARKITDFAEHIATLSQEGLVQRRKGMLKEVFVGLWGGLASTWSPKRIFEREHLKFCFRNLASIGSLFMFSYFVPSGSVFVQYSSVMPVTLTLLVVGDGSHQVGSMVYKNTHRLLGVVLGKVLPIIITWALFYFPCLSSKRFVVQALTTWFYVYIFTYTYYVSKMWGYVGCLIAGFGVYQLLVPCSADPVATFQLRYQEIGSVTFAIFVQAIIHGSTSRHTPEQLEVEALCSLGQAFSDGYQALFECDLLAMQAAACRADEAMARCRALLPECDPNLKVLTCGGKEFRYELCTQVLKSLDHLIGEFNLLIVAAKDWVPQESPKNSEFNGCSSSGVLEILRSRPAMTTLREEFMHSLQNMLDLHQMLIADRGSGDIESMRASTTLEAAPALYAQLAGLGRFGLPERDELTSDLRARLTIAVRALENSNYHLFCATEHCLKEIPV